MDTLEKLKILSADSQYDLACACGTTDQEHRRRGAAGKWLYPVSLPGGGTSILLKTLLSNACANDCKYCPLRRDANIRRCTLSPDARFMREHRLYQVDFLIRKYGFKAEDFAFNAHNNLSLDRDPKECWAENHPGFYPVMVNRADREALLRVPGFGPLTVSRILNRRQQGRLGTLHGLNLRGSRLQKALAYVRFD